MNFKEKLDQLKNIYLTDKNNLDLNNLKKKYTSKNNLLDEITDAFKLLNNEEKRLFGKDLQSFKQEVHVDLNPIVIHKIAEKKLDVTAYKPYQVKGHLHPYTHITRLLEDIFISMGYEIGQGTEVETEYINFEALNIPADHPARDMQDTFWLNIPNYLMRTHTSTVQIHSLAKKELPLAIFHAGRAYRCEATDASHDVVFMQAEGMVVSENITEAWCYYCIESVLLNCPHSVLARRANSKARTRNQNSCANVSLIVEHKTAVIAPCRKQTSLKASSLNALQPFRRDDLICIDITTFERNRGSRNNANDFHDKSPGVAK